MVLSNSAQSGNSPSTPILVSAFFSHTCAISLANLLRWVTQPTSILFPLFSYSVKCCFMHPFTTTLTSSVLKSKWTRSSSLSYQVTSSFCSSSSLPPSSFVSSSFLSSSASSKSEKLLKVKRGRLGTVFFNSFSQFIASSWSKACANILDTVFKAISLNGKIPKNFINVEQSSASQQTFNILIPKKCIAFSSSSMLTSLMFPSLLL